MWKNQTCNCMPFLHVIYAGQVNGHHHGTSLTCTFCPSVVKVDTQVSESNSKRKCCESLIKTAAPIFKPTSHNSLCNLQLYIWNFTEVFQHQQFYTKNDVNTCLQAIFVLVHCICFLLPFFEVILLRLLSLSSAVTLLL